MLAMDMGTVAPRAGAWIETHYHWIVLRISRVAPRAINWLISGRVVCYLLGVFVVDLHFQCKAVTGMCAECFVVIGMFVNLPRTPSKGGQTFSGNQYRRAGLRPCR